MLGRHVLLASEIVLGTLGLIVKIAGVFDGDGISFLRPVGAVAFGNDLSGDTHCANEAGWELLGGLR